jgi:hypothetical protein
MSSLRLALKKSLEENPAASSSSKNASFDFVDYEEISRVVGKTKRKRAVSIDPSDTDNSTTVRKKANPSDDVSIDPSREDDGDAMNITKKRANQADDVSVEATGKPRLQPCTSYPIIVDILSSSLASVDSGYKDDAAIDDMESGLISNEEKAEDNQADESAMEVVEDTIVMESEEISKDESAAKADEISFFKQDYVKSTDVVSEPSGSAAINQAPTAVVTEADEVTMEEKASLDDHDEKQVEEAPREEEVPLGKPVDDELSAETVDEPSGSIMDSQSAVVEAADQSLKDEDEEESAEESTKKAKKSTGKRRSGLLRSLGIMEHASSDNLEDINLSSVLDEPGPRLSSRAAAVVAKNRIASKATIIIASHVNTPREDENSTNVTAASTKAKKTSKSKAPQSSPAVTAAGSSTPQVTPAVVAEEVDAPWACCDRCSKWRKLPLTVDSSTLPEQWFCEMNIWDTEHNTCEAEEEVEDVKAEAVFEDTAATISDEQALKANLASESGNESEPKSLRSTTKSKKASTSTFTPGASKSSGLDATDIYSSSRLAQKRKSVSGAMPSGMKDRSGSISSSTAVAEEKINWIECSRCRKWRKAPLSVDVDSLPDTWVCEQNIWNPAFARCSAKQEPENEPTPVAGLTRSTSLTSVASSHRSGSGLLVPTSNYQPGTGGAVGAATASMPKKILMQWVQCERCEKWRKISPLSGVNHKDLPEKWYCEYNNWDPERGACEVPEESDNENDAVDAAVVAARSQLILANSKGPGALSYRRIIYGTDGRIRPIYSDKSKTGHGLFSFNERMVAVNRPSHADSDAYEEPLKRVSYWASSLYDEAGINYTSSSKAKPSSSGKDGAAGILLVSAIKGNPLSKTQLRLEELSRHYQEVSPVDSVLLHFHPPAKATIAMQTETSLKHSWPKKLMKACAVVDNATLLEQRMLFMSIVRSCFAADESMSLSLLDLFEMIRSAHFHNEAANYYRQRVSVDSLKMILKQMEDLGEVYVTTDSSGMCMIHYSKFDYTAATATAASGDAASSYRSTGTLLPPKLRAKHTKMTSVSVDN